MTIEQQTHYFYGKYSTLRKVVPPGTTFTWSTEFEGGEAIKQSYHVTDPDTLVYTVEDEAIDEGRVIWGDTINFLKFPQVKPLNWFEKLIGKDTQFYWSLTPGEEIKLEPVIDATRPSRLLRWEE